MIAIMSTTTINTTTTIATTNATNDDFVTKVELGNYNSCKIWLEGYNSQATKNTYKIHLSLFCKYHNINPDSLIQLKQEQIKIMVIDYIIHLKKNAKQSVGKAKRGEISVNSIKDYLTGIQSFLEFNDIILNWKKIVRYCPEKVTNHLRAYTREEIAKLLSEADLRDRCLILLMSSTGIRVGAIRDLRIKHLKKLQENNIGILSIYPQSKNSRYQALLTPECMAALEEYFEFRKRLHEKITQESHIIRDKFAAFSKTTNRARPLSEVTINKQMKFLLTKVGLSYEQLQPDHSLRKFFNTALMNSDVAHSFKELLMGHSVKLDDVYYDKDNEVSTRKLVVEYMKAIDALTINEEYRLKKKIVEYEDKLKEVPRIEQLESHLANKIIEQDAIKNQLERLQIEKQKETQTIQEKDEQVKKVNQQLNMMQSQMQALITILGNMDETSKNSFAKQLFQIGMYKTEK
jgi:integrase